MLLRRTAFSILLIFLFGCDEDELTTESLLTVDFGDNYESSYKEYYLIITNNRGEILDVSSVTNNSKYILNESAKEITNELGIFLLSVVKSNSSYSLEGFLDIDKNEKIVFKDRPAPSEGIQVYPANVTITNYPAPPPGSNSFTINNDSRGSNNGKEEILFDSNTEDDVIDQIKFTFNITQNDNLLLTNSYQGDKSGYIRIENIDPGDSYTFDYLESYIPHDIVVDFSFSESYWMHLATSGHLSNKVRHTLFNRNTWSFDPDLTEFRYIEGYDAYSTVMQLFNYNEMDIVTLFKNGSVITENEIVVPNNMVELVNKEIQEFQYNISGDIDLIRSQWSRRNDVQAKIEIYRNAKNKSKHLQEFPKELVEKYPFLNFNGLTHFFSNFIDIIEGSDYKKMVGTRFLGNDINPSDEELFVDFGVK